MKPTRFILLCFLPIVLQAQNLKEKEVPQSVQRAFQQKYPDQKKVEWELEDKRYEAEFKVSGKEVEVCFDEQGQWIETCTELDEADMPENLKRFLDKNYAGYAVKELMLVKTANDETFYELELRKGRSECELRFNGVTGTAEKLN